jgi:hypothetical protein
MASSASGKGYARGPRDPPRTGAGAKKEEEEEEEEGGRAEAEAANEAVDRTLGTYSRYDRPGRAEEEARAKAANAAAEETPAPPGLGVVVQESRALDVVTNAPAVVLRRR